MYFKRLELVGFKSFADKTLIEFEPGVTAIVGPNGCGKSNISDSIRWVLGEQSAKSMRGSEMMDVIFNGSAAKEPLNLAEVSLTLSNENKSLPIDYDEVTLTRRLYRSGESEYLINKNPVRLKDIHELLMGTGIGTESYSIIEQGKMDLILNSKPEDRREIFEEAAGITKFKSKKKEALRKLEQTEQNLLRVSDIIQEVKRSIGSIERQAKKAEQYKLEFEKLKKLELAVASREFLLFENERENREAEWQKLKDEEKTFLAQMQSVDARYGVLRGELQALESDLARAHAEELGLQSEIRKNRDRVLLNRERVGELTARREHQASQRETACRRLEEFAREYDRLKGELEVLGRGELESLEGLNAVQRDYAAAEAAANALLAEEEAAKARLLDIANERAHHQSALAKLRAQENALAARVKKLKEEESAYLGEIEELGAGLGPLFGGTADQPLRQRFHEKLKEFKEKIGAFFKSLVERRITALGPEEEGFLETQIQVFCEEIVKIQGQITHQESRLEHVGEMQKKLEAKLSLVLAEAEEALREENALKEKALAEESNVALLNEEERSLGAKLAEIRSAVKDKTAEKERSLVRLTETRSGHGRSAATREKAEKDLRWVSESKMNEEAQLALLEKEASDALSRGEFLEKEIVSLDEENVRLSARRDEALKKTEGFQGDRRRLLEEFETVEKERVSRQAVFSEAREKAHGYELESQKIQYEMDRLKERIFNAYQVDLVVESQLRRTEREAQAAFGLPQDLDWDDAKIQIQSQKEKLGKMGPVNLVAIEEYDEMKSRFEFLTRQQTDLTQAKDDLHKAILRINRTTRELFVDTFQKIQGYFTEYYRSLFDGGTAELVLLDEGDVLESGIEIVARPPGKKLQSISLLSGGEKALTAVALLFSLFKVRPSPFCVLDEIDAPLDESNIDRFCRVLKEFTASSQFILITHSKRTMNLADALYGITMAESAISKIISVRFSENAARNGKPKDPKEVLV